MDACMRILICVPGERAAPRGNSVAARRLEAGFTAAGHAVDVLAECEGMSRGVAAARVRGRAFDAILLMHAWRCAAAFAGVREMSAARAVVSLRGTDVNEMLYDERTRAAILAVFEECAAIVVFSDAMRASFAAAAPEYARKARVVPNGLVLEESDVDYRTRLGLPAGATVFVGLGGLREVKRAAWVAAMLAKLEADGGRLVYVHAGPVIEAAAGEALVALCREFPCVRYAGVVPHAEAAAFLRAGDVFVSGSRSEGMPHAVREAMLAGLPGLLSAIDGHRLMAAPEREALFFEDERSFATQARRLIEDAVLRARLGASARERVRRALREGDEIGAYLRLLGA
jgi:glycosyltransferase involved in cell wall biosynthesis